MFHIKKQKMIVFEVTVKFLICRQLKGEFKMFMQVDRAWKDLMRRVEDRPNAIKSALTPGTLETLQQNNLTLNIIQKNLEVY